VGQLHKFEGRDTVECKVKVTNAGDGLSEAMKVTPDELRLGQKVYLVIEGEVTRVTLQPASEGRGLIRVQSIRAGVATLVEESLVKEVLDEQRIAIEEASGVLRFPAPDEAAEA